MGSGSVYSSGLQNVGSYQVAGIPYVTSSTICDGSEKKLEFPYVTNNITIQNNSETLNSFRLSASTGEPHQNAYGSTGSSPNPGFPAFSFGPGIRNTWFTGSSVNDTVGYSISWWMRWPGLDRSLRYGLLGWYWDASRGQNTLRISPNGGNPAGSNYKKLEITLRDIENSAFGQLSGKDYLVIDDWAFYSFVHTYQMSSATGKTPTTHVGGCQVAADSANTGSYNHTTKWYVNGSLFVTDTESGKGALDFQGVAASNTKGCGGQIQLGSRSFYPDQYYRDVIYWNGALNSDQVTALYAASASYCDPAFFPTASSGLANSPDSGYVPSGEMQKFGWFKPTGSVGSDAAVLLNTSPSYYKVGTGLVNQTDINGLPGTIDASSPFAGSDGSSGDIRIHFKSTGSYPGVVSNKHYWKLANKNEKLLLNVKTKEIYVSANAATRRDFDVVVGADLTNIPRERMFELTGSGIDS